MRRLRELWHALVWLMRERARDEDRLQQVIKPERTNGSNVVTLPRPFSEPAANGATAFRSGPKDAA